MAESRGRALWQFFPPLLGGQKRCRRRPSPSISGTFKSAKPPFSRQPRRDHGVIESRCVPLLRCAQIAYRAGGVSEKKRLRNTHRCAVSLKADAFKPRRARGSRRRPSPSKPPFSRQNPPAARGRGRKTVDIKNSNVYAYLAAARKQDRRQHSWQAVFSSRAQEKITSKTST